MNRKYPSEPPNRPYRGNSSDGVSACLHQFEQSSSGEGHMSAKCAKFLNDTVSTSGGSSATEKETLKKLPSCHMELDSLTPRPGHTVLIHTLRFNTSGAIEPHKTAHLLDHHHVKLPHIFPEPDKHRGFRWESITRALQDLTKGKASVGDVENAILSYNHSHKKEWSFDALETYVRSLQREENNFSKIIARTATLALRLPKTIEKSIPLLRQNRNHSITLSQVQIACLLANAFFCTFPRRNSTQPNSEYSNFPTINFSSLFGHASKQKTQKLRAILHYFNTVTETVPDGLVTFERRCISPSDLPKWKDKKEMLTKLYISHEGSIEKDGEGMLQVDFASKFVGGGVLGKGLVQEEILFLMNPELIVSRLFTEKLNDNECLKITGSQKYSCYSGYSDRFDWRGPYTDNTSRDKWRRRHRQIIAIDAVHFKNPRVQYTKESIKRELNKAYCGFKEDDKVPSEYLPAIATGNWGCGAFNGDPKLKALIQMMAAAVVKRDLAYFTFGDRRLAEEIRKMHQHLSNHQIKVGHLYKILKNYCERHTHEDLYAFIACNTPKTKSGL